MTTLLLEHNTRLEESHFLMDLKEAMRSTLYLMPAASSEVFVVMEFFLYFTPHLT